MKAIDKPKQSPQDSKQVSLGRRLWKVGWKAGGLLILGWLVSIAWEINQYSRYGDAYLLRRYGTELPWITSAEVISLGPWVSETLDPHFRKTARYRRWPWSEDKRFVFKRKTIRGEEARKLAALWRRQTFLPGTIGCHEPGYVLRFYTGPLKRAEITLCWHCSNAAFPAVFDESLIVFEAFGTNGTALLETLQHFAPLPTAADFNYTNAPISVTEVEQRIAEAMKPKRQYDLWRSLAEFAVHSPQRDQFESSLGAKLGSDRSHEVHAAIAIIEMMKSSRDSKELALLLRHPEEEVRHLAGRALLEEGGMVSMPEMLESVGSSDQTTRFHAFAAIVALADMAQPDWDSLSNRVEAALGQFGTNAFPESYNGSRVRITAERRTRAWPLVERIAEVCGTNFIRNFPAPRTGPAPE